MLESHALVALPDCYCVRATLKALLVDISDLGGTLWIPKSVISDHSDALTPGERGDLFVSESWARKEGI